MKLKKERLDAFLFGFFCVDATLKHTIVIFNVLFNVQIESKEEIEGLKAQLKVNTSHLKPSKINFFS